MWTWRAAGRVRKGMSLIDYLFNEKREMLVRMIEFDEEWSGPWIAAPPRDLRRRSQTPKSKSDRHKRKDRIGDCGDVHASYVAADLPD